MYSYVAVFLNLRSRLTTSSFTKLFVRSNFQNNSIEYWQRALTFLLIYVLSVNRQKGFREMEQKNCYCHGRIKIKSVVIVGRAAGSYCIHFSVNSGKICSVIIQVPLLELVFFYSRKSVCTNFIKQ